MFTALDTSDGPIEFATTGLTSLPLESIKPTIKFRWPWCVIVKMASPDSSSNGFVAICPFPERLIGAGSSAGAALCLFFSFLLAGSSFFASSLASESVFVGDPPLLFSLPPPHNSTKTTSNTRITTTPPMVRRTLLCGFCGGGGGGGTSDTLGVLIQTRLSTCFREHGRGTEEARCAGALRLRPRVPTVLLPRPW